MQLLPLIFLVSVYVLTSNAECYILPITPTEYNGLTPCGDGGLIAGCDCCPDGQTACLNTVQVCALEGTSYICENESGSNCASQGLADCGSGCMLSSATCCPGQEVWCPAGYYCGANSNCFSDSSSSSGGGSSSPAAPKPSTPKNTAASSTSTSHSQSTSSVATRKGYSGISSLVTMVAMNIFMFS